MLLEKHVSLRACSTAIVVLATLTGLVRPGLAQGAETESPKAFRVEAGVRIGVDGRVEAVTPDPALHPVLIESLTAAVKRLRFQPLELEGRSVPGYTHVRMQGCAVPAEGGMQVVYEFTGTGPGLGRARPVYPLEAARAGVSATFAVVYRVEPDGRGVVESIEPDASIRRRDNTVDGRRIAGLFDTAITQWVESRTYVPEALDGHAVATRIQRRIEFVAPGDASRRSRSRARSESEPLCGLAREGATPGSDDVVLDRRFVLVPGA